MPHRTNNSSTTSAVIAILLYPDKLSDMELDGRRRRRIHFAAAKDNQHNVDVVSLFQKGTDFQFRKLAVEPSVQKIGVGNNLLQYITNYAKENGILRIWCNARTSAIGFCCRGFIRLRSYCFQKR